MVSCRVSVVGSVSRRKRNGVYDSQEHRLKSKKIMLGLILLGGKLLLVPLSPVSERCQGIGAIGKNRSGAGVSDRDENNRDMTDRQGRQVVAIQQLGAKRRSVRD